MQIPDYASAALFKLESGGFKSYIVGGCVRDSLLGIKPKDYDIASQALPEQVLELFRAYKTVTAGVKHGTVGVVINGVLTEITTFRCDGVYGDHRRPDSVRFTQKIEEDLSRRDFTVNAMAFSPTEGIIDPFGGERDLRAGVLRAVGNPDARFGEDALRILRGIRFASVYGLEPEPATAAAMTENCELLKNISAERICAEFFATLPGRYADRYIYKFYKTYSPVIPELSTLADRPDQVCGDMLRRSLSVMSKLDGSVWLTVAALFENLSYGGKSDSAAAASELLRRLNASRAIRENVTALIREPELTEFSRAELRRLIARLSPEVAVAFLRLRLASSSISGGDEEAEAYAQALATAGDIIKSGECVSRDTMELTGGDLAALGVKPGKKMGELLDTLFSELLEGLVDNTKPALAARASELIIKNKII
jgi:tRNA nucleotidyltransferase/poly(A) polymerase